jgi:hypothetical protein
MSKGLVGRHEGKIPFARPRHMGEGGMTLKWVLKKQDARAWLSMEWQVAGSCEHSNKPWGSIGCAEFLK